MLFDAATRDEIDRRWSGVADARGQSHNHWHESWNEPLDALAACYTAAKASELPQAWRTVVVQGRKVRAALATNDGQEHQIYIRITQFTDLADEALDRAGHDPKNLMPEPEHREVVRRLDRLDQELKEDRKRRGLFEGQIKRTLDEGIERVAKARKAVIQVGDVKPDITIFSTGFGEAADLIKKAIEFVNSSGLIERAQAAAKSVREATGRLIAETKARFDAFRLAWKRFASEGFFALPGIVIIVRDGVVNREERRIPGDGVPFRDRFLVDGKLFDGPEMVVVPGAGGIEPFAIGRFALTFAEWDAAQSHKDWQRHSGIAPRKPMDYGWGRGKQPAIDVNWDDAQAYCKWLSAITAKTYRLPSEAEWEHACRAGTTTEYSFGDDAKMLGDYAWFDGNSGGKAHPVGEKKSNQWGLFDVHGNVWEWCEDKWDASSSSRVLRGGSWNSGPQDLRSANRNYFQPGYRDYLGVGFRVARTL